MNKFLTILDKLITHHAWALHAIGILVVCLVLTWILRILHKRIQPTLNKTRQVWDSALLEASYLPATLLVWIYGLSFIFEEMFAVIGVHMLKDMDTVRVIVFLVFVIWFSSRFITLVSQNLLAKVARGERKGDHTTITAVSQIIRIALIVIVILIGMQTLGIPISALLAFGGIGSLAIGFAAKDTLANFLGGVMIFFDRPFSVGDWINSPDRDIEGTVDRVGWRLTKIISFQKRPIYVPNGVFSSIIVRNPSRMTNRRIVATMGLRYQDSAKMAAVTSAVEEMLQGHPDIDTSKTLMVYMSEFGPSSLNFQIYTFTKTTDWVKFQMIQQDVFLKIIEIVHQHGADFAFPTRTLDFPDSVKIQTNPTD